VNALLLETILTSGQTLQLVQGDITTETTDAIVNAANQYLQHGAGVAGAILRSGGPVIQQESNEWIQLHGSVSHAVPAWTSGGNLPCRYVIHSVGPVWGAGDEDTKMIAAVMGSLRVADELRLESLAFPAISTGIFGFPKERAADLMFKTFWDFFNQPTSIKLVRLVLYDGPTVIAFEKVWHDHFDPKH
jgi:O-acetyl-ADP-ribose deacetylase